MPREYSEEILSDNFSLRCDKGPSTIHPEQIRLDSLVLDDDVGRSYSSFAIRLSEGSRWLFREVYS